MSRAEIDSKFDEIVAFAEIKRFLNTPVKHYSSGMYVRLAFAVAAHLEPEILVVDEVLAVGDAAFQKKCLGKMNDIAKKGRTVLFVSHDISAITSLCERVVLLHEGEVLMNGETNRVVAHYLDRSNKLYTPITWSSLSGVSDAEIEFLSGSVVQDGVSTTVINCREPFDIEFKYRVKKPVPNCRLFLIIRNGKGEIVFTTSDYDQLPENGIERSKGTFVTRVYTPGELLKTGSYYVSFGADIKNERIVSCADDAVPFDVFEPEDDTLAERHRRVGVIAPLLEWRTEAVSPDSNAG
jgi:lipopolysaccharide transport system ATP-binding protein